MFGGYNTLFAFWLGGGDSSLSGTVVPPARNPGQIVSGLDVNGVPWIYLPVTGVYRIFLHGSEVRAVQAVLGEHRARYYAAGIYSVEKVPTANGKSSLLVQPYVFGVMLPSAAPSTKTPAVGNNLAWSGLPAMPTGS